MAPGGSRLPNGFTAYLKVSVNMDIAQMFPPEKVEQMGVSIMRHWSYLPANAVKDQYRLGVAMALAEHKSWIDRLGPKFVMIDTLTHSERRRTIRLGLKIMKIE